MLLKLEGQEVKMVKKKVTEKQEECRKTKSRGVEVEVSRPVSSAGRDT